MRVPPCCSTIARQTVRPRPVPRWAPRCLVEKYGSKILGRRSAGIPGPVVDDRHAHTRRGFRDVLRPDGDSPACGHRLACVQDEVPDDLAELRRIPVHQPEIRRQCEVALDRRPPQDERGGVPDHASQGEHPPDRQPALGEGEELLRQATGLQHGLGGGGEVRRGVVRGLPEQLEVHKDGHQQVVEVVGDPGRQDPRGFQLGPEQPRLLQVLAVREVDEHDAALVAGCLRGGLEAHEPQGARGRPQRHLADGLRARAVGPPP